MNRCLMIATIFTLSSLYSNFALADDTKSSAVSVEIQSEQKNKVGLLNDIQAISFEAFKTEFKYTISVDDFYRSLQRLKKNYQLDFSSTQLLSAQIDINGFKKSEIEKSALLVIEQARLRAAGREDTYYHDLEKLKQSIEQLNQAAVSEINLVHALRMLNNDINGLNSPKHEPRYRHLLNHARYEILSFAILKVLNSN